MSTARRSLAALFALAALVAAVPAEAVACGSGGHCAGMLAPATACRPGSGLLPAMTCCEPDPVPAPTASAPGLVASQSRVDPPAGEGAPLVAVAIPAPAPLAAVVAQRSRAEKRHAQGLFALYSAYRN